MGYTVGKYYLTTQKAYPSDTNRGSYNALTYKSIYMDGSKKTAYIKDIKTLSNSSKILQKCLEKPGSLSIEVYAGDLIKSIAYPAKVATQNVGIPMWRYCN